MAAVYRHSLDYGRIRLWGSLAFILGSLATGRLLAAYDADWVLWLVLGALAASAVTAAALPGRDPAHSPDAVAEDISLRRLARLFAQREVLIFLVASALIQSSHAASYGLSRLSRRAPRHGQPALPPLW